MRNKRIRIRLESWYWGNYEWSDSYLCKKNGWKIGSTAHGYKFEEYIEEKHGWQHSEEYKNGQLTPYGDL
jgi:hypothetical protein